MASLLQVREGRWGLIHLKFFFSNERNNETPRRTARTLGTCFLRACSSNNAVTSSARLGIEVGFLGSGGPLICASLGTGAAHRSLFPR